MDGCEGGLLVTVVSLVSASCEDGCPVLDVSVADLLLVAAKRVGLISEEPDLELPSLRAVSLLPTVPGFCANLP